MIELPNGNQAQLGDKLDRYVLNPQHPKGKDKATLFKNRLGITLENKKILEDTLLEVAINHEATIYKQDNYGTQYDIKFLMTTEVGKSLVISCWIIRADEDFPRLTNTYPVTK
jgi:methyl coenzyme M reductase gamma subunit